MTAIHLINDLPLNHRNKMEVGIHCSYAPCKKLDFLPFYCENCKQTFCQDHNLPSQHQCPVIKEVDSHVVSGTGNETLSSLCSVPGCGRVGIVEIKCQICHKSVCLSHRHVTEHECVPSKAKAGTKTKPSNLVTTQTKKLSSKGTKDGKQSSLSRKVALMRLKQKAEGLSSIPESERAYFEINLPLAYGGVLKPVYISTVWTVGRAIDYMSQKYKLKNKNDQPTEPKLCLYLENEEEHLSMKQTVQDILETVPLGSALRLEYH